MIVATSRLHRSHQPVEAIGERCSRIRDHFNSIGVVSQRVRQLEPHRHDQTFSIHHAVGAVRDGQKLKRHRAGFRVECVKAQITLRVVGMGAGQEFLSIAISEPRNNAAD